MSDLNLRFIGTGNAFAPGGLCWNGFLVAERFLFEAPPQALQSLNVAGVDPNQVEALILSHHHGDHFLGLPFLILHWKYMGRMAPLTIVGPPQTEELAKEIFGRVYPDLFDLPFEVQFVVAQPGSRLQVGALELEPVPVQHDTRLSLNLGYGARLNGRRFAYTGDTALCDAVLDLARDAEVLISECASRADNLPIHMNLVDDMPRLRATLPTSSHLLLTHLGDQIEASGLPKTIVARDYARYRF